MDTESASIAFSSGRFEDLVKPDLKHSFQQNIPKWFGRDDTDENILQMIGWDVQIGRKIRG
jgi:hypothetical protein